MNWLAHLYLSEESAAFRIGNLLPDLLPPAALAALPAEIRRGVVQHRRIDAFTDAHPVVRRSIQRVGPSFRRVGGILIDLFYDHFLARNWEDYSPIALPAFTAAVYASFEPYRDEVPPAAFYWLERMRAGDWLYAYREVDNIRLALDRLGARLRRPVPMAEAVGILEEQYDAFGADFRAFFPEVRAHVATKPA